MVVQPAWLDTGCGHDLIGRSKAKPLGIDIRLGDGETVFQAASGTTLTSDTIEYYVDELKETVHPYVLEETPTVLSI